MNRAVFVIFSQFILLLLQLVLGNWGLTLPFSLLGVFCTALAMGRTWGLIAGLFSGMTLAILYGGSWNLLYVLINPLAAGVLNWWIERHDEDINIRFWQPGACAGVLNALPALMAVLYRTFAAGSYQFELHWLILKILWSAAVSAGLFVFMLLLEEAAGEYLGLPRFLTRKGGIKR